MNCLKPVLLAFVFMFMSCTEPTETQRPEEEDAILRFEKISYYHFPKNAGDNPVKFKLTYYFDDGTPHRWMDLDSAGNATIEYIYEYDIVGKHTGARYREPGMPDYDVEKVRFENDSTQITEWIDSTGTVFYTMIDNLNKAGKSYRATFKGNEIHG